MPITGSFSAALGVLVAILVALITYFLWCFTYWKRKGVPVPSLPEIPFGNARNLFLQRTSMGADFKKLYEKLKSKGHKYGGYYFFTKPIFVPIDLDLIKNIFTKDFAYFTDHVTYINEGTDPLTGHIFRLKGQRWKNLRTKLTPTFSSGKIKMMFQTIADCSKGLQSVVEKSLEKGEPVDVKDVASRFTTDIIGSCAFGIECNSLKDPNSVFMQYGKKIFDLSTWKSAVRLLTFTTPQFLALFKLRSFGKEVHDFFVNLVKQTVALREKENIVRKDFMHLLIQLKNNVKITENELGDLKGDGDGALSLNEIVAQCYVFFVAGYETSSGTMTFCLYELAKAPEIQELLREEIKRVLAKHNGEVTYEAIMQMTYMDKCIYETLRKYPPLPVHSRECTQDYKVPDSDLILEKGTYVFIPSLGIQYDADYYPEPERFDPERFSEENKAQRHPAAWTPFGDGPRICIGLRFGMVQMKVGLCALLKNYKFSVSPKTKALKEFDPRLIITTPGERIWLDVERCQ